MWINFIIKKMGPTRNHKNTLNATRNLFLEDMQHRGISPMKNKGITAKNGRIKATRSSNFAKS